MAKSTASNSSGRILLFHGYEILVDSLNYSLVINTGRKTKDGDPVYRHISFHGTLEKALAACKKDMARREIMSVESATLGEAISVIVRSNNRFEALLKNCFEGVTN